MSRKKNKLPQLSWFNFLINDVLIIPVLFLKLIGDLVLFFFDSLIYILYTTYKIILYFLKQVFYSPLILFKKIVKGFSALKISFKFPILKINLPKIKLKPVNFNPLKPNDQERKKRLRRIKTRLKLLFIKTKFYLLGIITFALFIGLNNLAQFLKDLPNPLLLTSQNFIATTRILDRNGKLLYEIYGEQNRQPVKLKNLPKSLIAATLAIEDKEFYLHNGFSVRGITRAIIHNLDNDELEGGSTITQQLVRSRFLTPQKTLARKVKEIILAIWAEKIFTKDQILEMYFNQVPYGGTAWGIEAAAKTYFGKSTSSLTLIQSVFLAGLPASPTTYSPFVNFNNQNLYQQRVNEVLTNMLHEGYITKEEYEEAKLEKLEFIEPRTPIAAPHFVMFVRDFLEKYYGLNLVENGGLKVTTSLDLTLNEKIQRIVAEELEKIRDLNVNNAAVVVTNPQTGEILAMVGSADFFDEENDGNVNIPVTLQQPGSAIKVITYAAALQNGFTPATIINDAKVAFEGQGGSSYSPVNYDGRFHGPVSLRLALASSYNVPAVKVLNSIGIDKMIKQAKKMGVDSWQDDSRFGLSVTLGGAEVTMLDLARVYQTLGNGGVRKELFPFLSVTDYNGYQITMPQQRPDKRALPAEIAFILTDILSDNNARTPAFGENSLLNIPGQKVAVKTGTSDNKRDNWTIGFTPDYLVVAWVGNNDNSPMNPALTSGVTGAAPIWNRVMKELLKNVSSKQINKPEGLIEINCRGRTEYFLVGNLPDNPCPEIIKNTPTVKEEN